MSTKKRKLNATTQENNNETIRKPGRVFNGDPNPGVRNIPCNETGTFIQKVFVSCSFCSQKFDRPDEYYLHHAEKHAKLYGHLPNQPTNGPTNNSTPEVINNTPIRRRRCSVYVRQQSDTSSSESSESDNEVPVQINTNDADNNTRENLNDTKPRKKKKKISSKSKETDMSSTLNGDDLSSDREIQNLLGKFVKKLSKSLVKHVRNKKEKIIKAQRNIMYKCKECSLHFLKECEWRKHIKRADHPTNPLKCGHCMLKFSDKSLPEHVRMHTKDGQIQKKVRFYIITEKSYSSSEDGTSSDGTSSDSDSEENKSVPNSSHDGGIKNVKESAPTEKEQHFNCTDTDNVKNTNEVDSNKNVNAKKRFKAILYKCDDCEKHFLTRQNVISHTKNSTHHYSNIKACNICTIKFSGPITLRQHKQKHHSGTENLSKEDFRIIPWSSKEYGKSLPDRVRVRNPKKDNCTDNRNKSPKKSLSNFILYRCEGCDTHFTRYKIWWSHLTYRCKNTISHKIAEKCPKCEIYFIPSSFSEHLKVHEDNPALLKHQFRIQSRKPKNFNNKIIPQSNIVSTTEAEVEPPSASGTADSDSLVNQGNDRDTSSANDLCKVKLTKTTTGQGEGWRIIKNQSVASMNVNKNSNPPLGEEANASTIDDHMNANQACDQNFTRDIETDRVGSTVENNAETVTSKYFNSVADMTNTVNSVTDPTNKTSHHTEKTVSSENKIHKNMGVNVIVNIPKFQNNTSSEENTDRFIVSTADTTTENFENNYALNVNNKMDQNRIRNTKHENDGDEIKTENDTNISGDVPIQNECLKVEIKSENDSFEPQGSTYNQNITITETVVLGADQHIKNESLAEEIKAENIVTEEYLHIKNNPFIEEIKTENLMSEENSLIELKENIKTQDNDVAPETVPTVKYETVAEEIPTVIDDSVPETQNDTTVISDIKITNSFSLQLKFEDDPQPDSEEPSSTENEVSNIDSIKWQDMDEVVDNIVQPEIPQSTHMAFDDKNPDNNEIHSNKSARQLKRDITSHNDDDDSQDTIILVWDDEREQAGTQKTENDAQPDENAERNMSTNNFNIEVCKNENSHSSENNKTQNKELNDNLIAKHRAQNEKNDRNNDHLTNNNAWGSKSITTDKNSSHIFNVHRIDDAEATPIDFGSFRVRDRTEIIKIKEEPGTSKHIKMEKADDQRTKTKLMSENEELNKNTDIINLCDDDDVIEISTVETVVIDDDDELDL